MNAICLICREPNKIWCNFLDQFKNYKIYIIVDFNTFDCLDFIHKYQNINFIQMNNNECYEKGFVNLNFLVMKKPVTGWDKALYYFAYINTQFENVWFIEDDVFFYNENTILNIDNKYKKSDLITKKYERYDNTNHWHWKILIKNIFYDKPYFCSMVCACRMSKILIHFIKMYAEKYGTLFFLESCFPNTALKNNLIYDTPDELNNVTCNPCVKNIYKNSIHHPVKNIILHEKYRIYLDDNDLIYL